MRNKLFTDENLSRLIVQAAPSGMIIADRDGKIVVSNPAAEQMFGYQSEEMVGCSVEILIPEAHHAAHIAHRARYIAQPQPREMAAGRDLFGQRKDGSQFPVDISLHPIQIDNEILILAYVVDATERHRAEEQRRKTETMERLAMLGQLAGGVAHEIRTPLCVIRNDAYFLNMMSDSLDPELVECVMEINEAVGKANRIVSELLDFTRDPESHLEQISPANILHRAIKSAAISSEIAVRVELPVASSLTIHVDPDQIERILINLLRNASQAIEGYSAGRKNKDIVRDICVVVDENDGYVTYSVIDSGPGISESELNQVFEPLYTTKAKGIGLGLAVSRRYAERNGGTLSVVTHQGGGACFVLRLPVSQVNQIRSDSTKKTVDEKS